MWHIKWHQHQRPWISLLMSEIFLTPMPLEMYHLLNTIHLHVNGRANMACNYLIKTEGLVKVTGSHLHAKSVSRKQDYFVIDEHLIVSHLWLVVFLPVLNIFTPSVILKVFFVWLGYEEVQLVLRRVHNTGCSVGKKPAGSVLRLMVTHKQ